MLKVMSSFAACAVVYSIYVLDQTASYEAGNVETNHALISALALTAGTLILFALHGFTIARVSVAVFGAVVSVLCLAIAIASWSVPAAGATAYLGVAVLTAGIPVLGVFAVASVLLTINLLAIDNVLAKMRGHAERAASSRVRP